MSVLKSYELRESKDIINANGSFIFSHNFNYLSIYFIYLPDEKPINAKMSGYPFLLRMNPFFDEIFLISSNNEIEIWEISKLQKNCFEKIKIKGHTNSIIAAVFCEDNNQLLASYSNDHKIKIWNFEKPFCVNSISVNMPIFDIKLFFKYLIYIEQDHIIIYDNKLLTIKKKIQIKIKECNNIILCNEDKFIILTPGIINIYSKGNNVISRNYNNNLKIKKIFYNNNLENIFIFFLSSIQIYNTKDLSLIKEEEIQFYNDVFLLDNEIIKENMIVKFLLINFSNNSYHIYSFAFKEYNTNNFFSKSHLTQEFWKNCILSISENINLSWERNEIDKIEISKKKYINIEEIEKEIKDNYKKSLYNVKKYVENELKKVSNNTNINYNYIDFLKLIILDNTNKDLITKYLNFIEKNEISLQKGKYKDFYETFNDELKYYSILFEKNNAFLIEKKLNKLSEKELFFKLLEEIRKIDVNKKNEKGDIDNLDSFLSKIVKILNKIQKFNQPITFDNQELYWFRNKVVIYFSLRGISKSKIKNEKFILMTESIEEIFKRKLFEKDYVLKDKKILTSLLSLIALPQDKYYLNFDLNLIETLDKNYNYEREFSDNNFKRNINSKNEVEYNYTQLKDNKIKINYTLNKKESFELCIKNFILKIETENKEITIKDEDIKTFKKLNDYYYNFINVKRINCFLAKIFCSNTFKEAFSILYPDYYEFPFKNEKESFKFIENYFNYIPLKNKTTNAFTEKLTLESYYFMKDKKITLHNNFQIGNLYDLVYKTFYISGVIKTNSHELNHEFYNIIFLHSNGDLPLETPRKKKISQRESGRNLEMILFGREIKKINLSEALYILNEKNYEKNLEKFREGFNEKKDDDLKLEGIFKEFNELHYIKEFNEIAKESTMTCDDIGDDNAFEGSFIEDLEDSNDVLGFIRK